MQTDANYSYDVNSCYKWDLANGFNAILNMPR